MKKYFLDTNIVIDLLLQRQIEESGIFKLIVDIDQRNIYVSALTVHIVFYVLKLNTNTELFVKAKNFFSEIKIVPLTEETINKALDIKFRDFEDTLQYFSAIKDCDCILTRNRKDFEYIKKILPSNIMVIDKYKRD